MKLFFCVFLSCASLFAASPITVATIAALKALLPGAYPSVQVEGYYAKSDGGGGVFYWAGTSTASQDSCTIWRPSTAPATGRWIRLYQNPLPADACGITGDGVTNDAADIQAAINYSNSSNGTEILLSPGTHFVGTTQLELKSGSALTGSGIGLTLIRSTGGDTIFNIASSVSKATAKAFTLTCDTNATSTIGFRVGGDSTTLQNIKTVNMKIGVQADTSAAFGNIDGYTQYSTVGVSSFGFLFNGVKDWNLNNIALTGSTTGIGIDKGIAFQNGETMTGCARVRASNVTTNYMVAYGVGGAPDDFGAANATWLVYFKTVGYTNAVGADIGDTVLQGGTGRGILLAYDNTARVWCIGRFGTIATNTATTLRNGSAGTGAGTTLINNQQVKAPTTTDNTWTGFECNYGISALIGHGISLDACFSTHVSQFSTRWNTSSGVYIGDNLSYGSTVSSGTSAFNGDGVTLAGSAISSVTNLDINNNGRVGIYFIPIANGLNKNVQFTLIANNNIYRNSRNATLSVDAGIGGEPSFTTFQGNNIFENYFYGVGIAGGTDNLFTGNMVSDNGWRDSGAAVPTVAFYIEGVSRRNRFEQNLITARISPNSLYRGFEFVTNADSNIVRNNWIYNWTNAAINDGGIANQDFDNVKTQDPATLANGTGNIVRKQSAGAYELGIRRYNTPSALIVEDSGTTGGTVSRFIGATNTSAGLEPFQRIIGVYNRHADYSTDMVAIKDTGAGAVNSANGSYLRILNSSGSVLLVQPDSMTLGKASYKVKVPGTATVTGVATFTAAPVFSSTTASTVLAVDGSKALASLSTTGTGTTAVLSVGPTFTGTVTHAATALTQSTATSSSNLIAIDASLADFYKITLAQNNTLSNPTNSASGRHFTIRLKQDATGSRTLAYGTNYRFPGSTEPVLSTGANAIDYLSFIYDEADSKWDFVGNAFNLQP